MRAMVDVTGTPTLGATSTGATDRPVLPCRPRREAASRAPGNRIDYECLHDNGVPRLVKLETMGNPIHLRFGATTGMCVLPGVHCDD